MGGVRRLVPVRAPHLYPLLRWLRSERSSFSVGKLEEGVELPFAFEEHVQRNSPALYELRPLVRAFIEERGPCCVPRRCSPRSRRACARTGGFDLRSRACRAVRDRGRRAVPHGVARARHLHRRVVRGSTGTTMRSSMRTPRSRRRSPGSGGMRGTGAAGRPLRGEAGGSSLRVSQSDASCPASSPRTGRNRAACCPPVSAVNRTKLLCARAARRSRREGRRAERTAEIADAVSAIRLTTSAALCAGWFSSRRSTVDRSVSAPYSRCCDAAARPSTRCFSDADCCRGARRLGHARTA